MSDHRPAMEKVAEKISAFLEICVFGERWATGWVQLANERRQQPVATKHIVVVLRRSTSGEQRVDLFVGAAKPLRQTERLRGIHAVLQ